jgi:hypothetical protein
MELDKSTRVAVGGGLAGIELVGLMAAECLDGDRFVVGLLRAARRALAPKVDTAIAIFSEHVEAKIPAAWNDPAALPAIHAQLESLWVNVVTDHVSEHRNVEVSAWFTATASILSNAARFALIRRARLLEQSEGGQTEPILRAADYGTGAEELEQIAAAEETQRV